MNCLKAPLKKQCLSYENEETSDKRDKTVKNIVATAHDINLEAEEEDVEELLERIITAM